MPFRSQAQAGWAFATGQPWAKRWARETGPYKRLPIRLKAPNYNAKRGQVIAGRLVRGEGGRFSSSNAASSASRAQPAQPKGRKAPKLAKPKLTPEQRQQQREQARTANRATVDKALGLMEDTVGALDDLRAGKAVADDGGLVKLGLAEQAADGSYRLTPAGRALAAARDAGDTGRARDTMSRAADRYAAGQNRAAAQRERQGKRISAAMQRERQGKRISAAMQRATQAKPKPTKVGGGGGSKKKPPVVRRTPARSSSRPQAAGNAGGGGGSSDTAKPELPANLVAAARALSAGQTADEELLIRNGLAKRGKDGRAVLTAQGLRAIRTKSFAVFKDSTGAYRWIARTTTAFEDRDAEVISTKALEDSAASSDDRGPLRFWHMGRPDPLSAQPWGPGVDLGWCDFAATHGRTLIESGTFKSEAIARAVAAKADQLELSPGFFHAPMEPDASGVFHHIRIFERSLVPKWAGRASNPYTGLVVEKAMDPKKLEALQALGLPDTTIKELLAEVATTEKAAEADGVRYKADDEKPTLISTLRAWLGVDPVVTTKEETPAAEPVEVTRHVHRPELPADVAGIAGQWVSAEQLTAFKAQIDRVQAELATLKAGPPAEVETQADELVETELDAELPMDEEMGGEMSADEFISAIGAMLDAKLGPLVEALGITAKLDGHFTDLKSLLGGFSAQKDDAQAQAAEQIAALKAQIDQQQAALADSQAKLGELIDDAPRGGYRPSQAQDNVNIWANPQLLAAMKDGDTSDAPFVADDGMSLTDHFFGQPKR